MPVQLSRAGELTMGAPASDHLLSTTRAVAYQRVGDEWKIESIRLSRLRRGRRGLKSIGMPARDYDLMMNQGLAKQAASLLSPPW